MQFVKQYKPYLIFSGLVIIGLLIFALISQGFYPIATVEGKIITAHSFWQKYQADYAYYQNFTQSLDLNSTENKTTPPSAGDFKKSALTQLIENIIISNGAEEELGDDLPILVENKISKIPTDEKFKQAISGVYGANLSDFVDDFMVPLAKQEILEGRLFLRGEDFDAWFIKAKSEAKVKIFSDEFYWDGQEVQLGKE